MSNQYVVTPEGVAGNGAIPLVLRQNWVESNDCDPVAAARLLQQNRKWLTTTRYIWVWGGIASFLMAFAVLLSSSPPHPLLVPGWVIGAFGGVGILCVIRYPGITWGKAQLLLEQEVATFAHDMTKFCLWSETAAARLRYQGKEDLRKKAEVILIYTAIRVEEMNGLHTANPSGATLHRSTELSQEFKEKFVVLERLGLTKGTWGSYYDQARKQMQSA